jgi:hypothetical protein
MANKEGLSHYEKHGYKGRLSGEDSLRSNIETDKSWISVEYNCNRGIVHSGTWPHLSTKITSLKEGVKRVILGFNCFVGDEVGACCARAPEHSDAFNRTVKLYQVLCRHISIFMRT